MLEPKPFPESDQKPLPLFRAEAMAAQQQKFYGEILLIRPLSLRVFFWCGMGISTLALGFLLLASASDHIRAMGILSSSDTTRPQADIYVPAAAIQFVHAGETVPVHCQFCSGSEAQSITASVTSISRSEREPMYKITLTLPPAEAGRFSRGARVEADLPTGRKPLLKWLFERR